MSAQQETLAERIGQLGPKPGECDFYTTDLELAAEIKQILLDHSVPAYLEALEQPLHRIVAPAAFALRSRTLIERRLNRAIITELNHTLLFEPAPPQPEILRSDRIGSGAMEELTQIVRGAVSADRQLAAERLRSLGGFGIETQYELLAECCLRNTRERGWELVTVLARSPLQPVAQTFLELLGHADGVVRFNATMFIPGIGSAECVPALIQLLNDPDVDVRAEAADALWELTGENHQYDPTGPEETRKAGLRRWEAWLDKWA